MHAARPNHTTIAATAATAAIVVLGAHVIRVFIPLIGWYLRDVERVGTLDLIPYALAPFLAAFLAPLIVRGLGATNATWLAVAGLAAARVGEQLSTEPGFDLWIAMLGVALFLWALPLIMGFAVAGVATGLLLGLATDTALKGATRTLDLSWMEGFGPVAATVILGAVALAAVRRLTHGVGSPSWPARGSARSLIVIGPLLVLEWMILQNQGWVATQTHWSSESALLLITAANASAIVLIGRLPTSRRAMRLLCLASGVVLLGVGVAAFAVTGLGFAAVVFVGVLSAAVLLAAALGSEFRTDRFARTGLSTAAGMLFFLLLTLVYFISIDRDLFGLMNRQVLVVVGATVALSAVVVALRPATTHRLDTAWPASLAGLLILVPLSLLLADSFRSTDDQPVSETVTVMAYNLHSAFDGRGLQDPEALARTIEESEAQVIGIQEVPRGWFLNGSTDLVTWLAARLDMPHWHFVGAADPAWGNAILSRYPLENVDTGLLPLGLIPHQRSYHIATVSLGEGRSFSLINTHLQQVNDPSIPDEERERDLGSLHLEQMGTVVEAWNRQPRTVLTGDLNAQPGWVQMDYLLGEGFVDGLGDLAAEEAYTSGYWDNEGVARWRVDWVVHTADLKVISARVIRDDTSDHYPQVVEFDLAP